MKRTDFYELLINPSNGNALQFDAQKNALVDPIQQQEYSIKQEIPILLIKEDDIKGPASTSNVHGDHQSDFNYREHYQKDAVVFDYFAAPPSKATIHEEKRLHQYILSQFKNDSNLILDVGCGKGWLSNALLPKGKKVISMDISFENPLKTLQNNPSENHLALVADVYHLPIKDDSLDCIVASEIMEHVPDPEKFIAILYSKLKPGGTLIITTPYNEKIEYYLCVHCNKPTPKNAHIHSFNEFNIDKLIPKAAIWTWNKFGNKYLIKFRTHVFLSILPFAIWKGIDKLFSLVFKNETRLLIKISKGSSKSI